MWPNRQPPTGLIRKPAAKMPAVLSSCVVGFPLGKKADEKYSARKEWM